MFNWFKRNPGAIIFVVWTGICVAAVQNLPEASLAYGLIALFWMVGLVYIGNRSDRWRKEQLQRELEELEREEHRQRQREKEEHRQRRLIRKLEEHRQRQSSGRQRQKSSVMDTTKVTPPPAPKHAPYDWRAARKKHTKLEDNRARKRAPDDPNQELTVGQSANRAIGGVVLFVLLLILMIAVSLQFSNKDSPEPKPTSTPQAQLKIIYVTGSVVNIREGPSTGFPVVTKLKKGHKLVELSRDGDWVNITLEGTINAWIHASLVSAEPQAEKSP